MKEFLKKTAYTGLGLASMAVDGVKKLGKNISEKMKPIQEKGQKTYEKMKTNTKKKTEEVQDNVQMAVNKSLEKIRLAKKSTVDKLKKKIAELETRLSGQEGSAS